MTKTLQELGKLAAKLYNEQADIKKGYVRAVKTGNITAQSYLRLRLQLNFAEMDILNKKCHAMLMQECDCDACKYYNPELDGCNITEMVIQAGCERLKAQLLQHLNQRY